jgi:hypothetical protein
MPKEHKRFHLVVIRNQCSPKPQRKKDFHKWPSQSVPSINCGRVTSLQRAKDASPKKIAKRSFFLADPKNRMFAFGLRTFSPHELSASAKDLLFQAFHSKSFR